MHIPSVTDEMLDRVIAIAASLVVVDFTHAGCREAARARKALEFAADRWDDRIIFLRVWIEENPTVAARTGVDRPSVVIWRRRDVVSIDDGARTLEQLEDLLGTVFERFNPGDLTGGQPT